MALHGELTREIEEAMPGPTVAAFFDLDRTLLAGYSAGAFIRDDVINRRMSGRELLRTLSAATLFQLGHLGFSGFIADTVARFSGVAESDFEATAERIFTEELAAAIYPESRALVEA